MVSCNSKSLMYFLTLSFNNVPFPRLLWIATRSASSRTWSSVRYSRIFMVGSPFRSSFVLNRSVPRIENAYYDLYHTRRNSSFRGLTGLLREAIDFDGFFDMDLAPLGGD